MTDIGGFLANGQTEPTAINNAGQIVGNSSTGSYEEPFFDQNNIMTQLPIVAGYVRGTATAISANGNIAGTCYDANLFSSQALAWIGGSTYDLGSLAGWPNSRG